MLIDPQDLKSNFSRLEEIEKSSLRLVVQAIYDYREAAKMIFKNETDSVADIAEDVTREALDRLGMSRIDQRLFGKVDYKRARYLFHPEYAIKQALFIDSKAEAISGEGTATLQISQLSMSVKQLRAGKQYDVPGSLASIIKIGSDHFLSTTIFVKYNYDSSKGPYDLKSITLAALPNGILQGIYNPDSNDSIWLAGRNAPTLGEEFRVRLSFSRLKSKAKWRVQKILLSSASFVWDE